MKLNIDGTYKHDINGEKQATYTNDDIVAFAEFGQDLTGHCDVVI